MKLTKLGRSRILNALPFHHHPHEPLMSLLPTASLLSTLPRARARACVGGGGGGGEEMCVCGAREKDRGGGGGGGEGGGWVVKKESVCVNLFLYICKPVYICATKNGRVRVCLRALNSLLAPRPAPRRLSSKYYTKNALKHKARKAYCFPPGVTQKNFWCVCVRISVHLSPPPRGGKGKARSSRPIDKKTKPGHNG